MVSLKSPDKKYIHEDIFTNKTRKQDTVGSNVKWLKPRGKTHISEQSAVQSGGGGEQNDWLLRCVDTLTDV